jgi:hypothetical protein
MSISVGSPSPVYIIACQVLLDLLEELLPADLKRRAVFLDYALHRVPAKMNWELQKKVDEINQTSLIILGYGLCGNGLIGLKAGIHTLLVPRCDDCISMLLGSRSAYFEQFAYEPGTYWLSKGWLASGSHPLSEFNEYREKYGEKDATWLIEQQYQGYKRLAFVAHHQEDLDTYRPEAQKVADFCKQWQMGYQEILGSDQYVRKMVDLAILAGEDMVNFLALANADKEFLVISPGEEIRQDMFIYG